MGIFRGIEGIGSGGEGGVLDDVARSSLAVIATALASMIFSNSLSRAEYLGLSLESTDSYFSNHPSQIIRDAWNAGPVSQYDIYRLYANFDTNTTADRVNAAGGLFPGSPLSVVVVGGTFFNYTTLKQGDHFNVPGSFPLERAWDTWVTIGNAVDGGTTILTPGFDVQTNDLGDDTNVIGPTTEAAWFVTPIAPQGFAVASAPSQQNAPPGIYRVLLAQFTVTQGSDNIVGNARVNVNGEEMLNQTFAIPAPGALALLAFAGIFTPRRRLR